MDEEVLQAMVAEVLSVCSGKKRAMEALA